MKVRTLVLSAWIGFSATNAWAEEFEAVSARANGDYVRAKLPDGSYPVETYAFGKGGYWSGPVDDKTIDKMDFLDVARVIAAPLATQNYLPARDPKTTRLLILVYWGTTYAPEHASESLTYDRMQSTTQAVNIAIQQGDPPQVIQQLEDMESIALTEAQRENYRRDNADLRNAMMLGYDSWWASTFNAHSGTPQERERQDMMHELEEDRYFVVLMAYDFQLLRQKKQHKLLWETRFSIREHVHAFDQALPAMALEASRYFGKDSGGLTHKPLPDGTVNLGELRNLGPVPEK